MKYKYINFLNVLATFAVVCLHVNNFWSFNTANWPYYNFVESLCYFAVPVFAMISGATLIDYREKYDTKTFFKRRFLRVLLPYLIFSFIYIISEYFLQKKSISFKEFKEIFLNGRGFGIFGFFILIMNLYLCIPIISLIPSDKRKEAFGYLILLGIILNAFLPQFFRYLNISFTSDWNLNLLGGYLLFALIGYYIHKYPIEFKNRICLYILGIISLLVMCIGTYNRSMAQGSIDLFYKSYLNLFSIIYASSIFLFFRYLENSKFMNCVDILCSKISRYCLGVYLIHVWIKNKLGRFAFFNNREIYQDIILILILFVGSLLIYYLIIKLLDFCKKHIIKPNKREQI
jgi:surface polysaccharide O-acyltransferase-like enzyme